MTEPCPPQPPCLLQGVLLPIGSTVAYQVERSPSTKWLWWLWDGQKPLKSALRAGTPFVTILDKVTRGDVLSTTPKQ